MFRPDVERGPSWCLGASGFKLQVLRQPTYRGAVEVNIARQCNLPDSCYDDIKFPDSEDNIIELLQSLVRKEGGFPKTATLLFSANVGQDRSCIIRASTTHNGLLYYNCVCTQFCIQANGYAKAPLISGKAFPHLWTSQSRTLWKNSLSTEGHIYIMLTKNCCSNQRTRNQFRPRNANKGTTSYQLRQYAEATLGGGSLRKIVKLPEGEDENEWLAVNSMVFYMRIFIVG